MFGVSERELERGPHPFVPDPGSVWSQELGKTMSSMVQANGEEWSWMESHGPADEKKM